RAPDLPGHLHEGRLLVGSFELHAEALGRGLHAVEAAQEVDVPPVASELAVGDRLKPDRLLECHGAPDRLILDRAQRGAVDLAARRTRSRLAELGRAQETPDVVGAKWRPRGDAHRCLPATTRAR